MISRETIALDGEYRATVGNPHVEAQIQTLDQITRKWSEHGWHHVALVAVSSR